MDIYESLKRYVVRDPEDRATSNMFVPVTERELADAERRLGLHLPGELREFYLQVGYGFLTKPVDADDNPEPDNLNRFVHPASIADLYLGESLLAPSEGFSQGDVPFFETADSVYFVVRPGSDVPDAVYSAAGDPISNSVRDFVEKLAADPGFYDQLL